MRTSSVLALVLSSLAAYAAANELEIIKTNEVECDRRTKVRPILPSLRRKSPPEIFAETFL